MKSLIVSAFVLLALASTANAAGLNYTTKDGSTPNWELDFSSYPPSLDDSGLSDMEMIALQGISHAIQNGLIEEPVLKAEECDKYVAATNGLPCTYYYGPSFDNLVKVGLAEYGQFKGDLTLNEIGESLEPSDY